MSGKVLAVSCSWHADACVLVRSLPEITQQDGEALRPLGVLVDGFSYPGLASSRMKQTANFANSARAPGLQTP